MYISLWENSRGHPDNVSFMQFSTKIDGFEQKDSQGFENSYNSYEQYPLEKFFIFTIYQNYTLAVVMAHRNHLIGEIICESPNWQHIQILKMIILGANWQLFRLERIAKCSYFILSTQNIKFY